MQHTYKDRLSSWVVLTFVGIFLLPFGILLPVGGEHFLRNLGGGVGLMLGAMVLTLLITLLILRRRVIVDADGMRFVNFYSLFQPRDFTWAQLREQQEIVQSIFGRAQALTWHFTLVDGYSFLVNISAIGMAFVPVDPESPSLRDAIVQFSGRQPTAAPSVLLPGNQDLGREAGLVTYTALGLFMFGIVLLFAGMGARYLEIGWGGTYLKVVGLAAALGAAIYQRKCPNPGALALTSGLFAGGVVVVAGMLPLVLITLVGPTQHLSFSLVKEEYALQYWQSVDGQLQLDISGDPTRFVYSERSVHTFAVHHGLFGVFTISGREYLTACDAPLHPSHVAAPARAKADIPDGVLGGRHHP